MTKDKIEKNIFSEYAGPPKDLAHWVSKMYRGKYDDPATRNKGYTIFKSKDGKYKLQETSYVYGGLAITPNSPNHALQSAGSKGCNPPRKEGRTFKRTRHPRLHKDDGLQDGHRNTTPKPAFLFPLSRPSNLLVW